MKEIDKHGKIDWFVLVRPRKHACVERQNCATVWEWGSIYWYGEGGDSITHRCLSPTPMVGRGWMNEEYYSRAPSDLLPPREGMIHEPNST